MSDICEVICLGYGVGFAVTAVLVAHYMLERRIWCHEGFKERSPSVLWSGVLICAALWPVIVAALAVNAVRMSLKREGAE